MTSKAPQQTEIENEMDLRRIPIPIPIPNSNNNNNNNICCSSNWTIAYSYWTLFFLCV